MPKKDSEELQGIKLIVNDALNRILSMKTKRTYQAELHVISKTIEDYIKTTYVSKEIQKKELLEQIFGYINQLKGLENKLKRLKPEVKEGIKLAIKELETNIYKNGK